jgi:hypothetical protein
VYALISYDINTDDTGYTSDGVDMFCEL